MDHWIIDFGQSFGQSALIAVVLNIAPKIYRRWRDPKKRQKVKRRASEFAARLGSIFSANQYTRYREMRALQLTKQLRELVLFRRTDEMQVFSKIFSSLASAGANFLILCIFVSWMSLILGGWVLSTVEREILHMPVKPLHFTTTQIWVARGLEILFVFVFLQMFWNIITILEEAETLSATSRARRFSRIKKKLGTYGLDPEQLVREIKRTRQSQKGTLENV